LLLVISLTACPKKESELQQPRPTLAPLPQDPFIEAYFNQSQASTYTEPYRHQARLGDNLEEIIVETIAGAKLTVDVAVQEFQLPEVAHALAEKHRAGVRVRVIIENNYNRPLSSLTEAEVGQLPDRDRHRYEEFFQLADINADGQLAETEINQRDALVILANAGVPLLDDTGDGSKGTGLMHHKFVVVDGQTTVVTSANFTTSGTHGDFSEPTSRGNANNLLKIDSAELANLFTEEFNLMWGDGPGGNLDSKFGIQKPLRPLQQVKIGEGKVGVRFAPTSQRFSWQNSVNASIYETLNKARNTIDFALFVFSEQVLVDSLEARQEAGVEIRGLIDSNFVHRYYSGALDMMGVALSLNCKYQPGNRPWKKPIFTVGKAALPPGDRLHHKFAIIDGKIAIAGSHNWSQNANFTNDETLLIIENPTVAAHFQREFDRLYQNAAFGVPQAVIKKVEEQEENCVAIESRPGIFRTPGEKVNLNLASQQELETLPGIGPKLAEEIIKARAEKPFTSLADLDDVPGIGPKKLEQLSNLVTW
jgi:competence ComEA-like helix-hairpin-helix protein